MLTEKQKQYKENMILAIHSDDLGMVKELFKNEEYFIDDEVVKCINLKAKHGSEILIKINKKLEENAEILYSAISTENHEEVKRICTLGFNKNYFSERQLNQRIKLEYGYTNFNPDYNSLISKALKVNNKSIIKILVAAGANTNLIVDELFHNNDRQLGPTGYNFRWGFTPLMDTIKSNNLPNEEKIEIVQILLDSPLTDMSIYTDRSHKLFNLSGSTSFDYAKGQPEIEKLLFKKLQEKESLEEVEQKHFNRYMKNAMNDIFKDVKAQSKSINGDSIEIIDKKVKEYFPSLKGNEEYDNALNKLFKNIEAAQSKDKEASKNTLDAIVKFFEKLLRFVTNNSIEKEAFKKLELEIMPYIMKPDMKEVDKQASKPETSEKNPQSHRR